MAAEPVAVNSRLGTYTNFCNLMDMCAVAVPSGSAGEDQFGVSVVARSGALGHDGRGGAVTFSAVPPRSSSRW